MTIDWTKPVRTKCGKAVRVLCTDRKSPAGDYSVVVLVRDGDYEYCESLDEQGHGSHYVFENVPVKCSRWINVYADGYQVMHPSKEEADRRAYSHRLACVRVDEHEVPTTPVEA